MRFGETLANKIRARREIEAGAQNPVNSVHGNANGHVIAHTKGNLSVYVTVPEVDKLSFNIHSFQMFGECPQNMPLDKVLQAQADLIEKRIDYLTESLTLVELDHITGRAQIRSDKPLTSRDHKIYFECVLEAGKKLSFCRFKSGIPHHHMKKIPFVVTDNIFIRLIDDCARIWELHR